MASSQKGRKTKPLKYNLHDRCRSYTGIDRSNVDFMSMINLINHQATQEMVESGQMLGFYGHQVRQRFGMTPPESVPIDGKMVYLEPAFKTIALTADRDGNVTHQAEFLNNDSGEFARRQYLAKVGGFSTAVNYKRCNTQLIPSGFFGFDYVTQPNYTSNVGDGQLFDGLYIPERLDSQEFACFDSATAIETLDASQRTIAQLLEQQIVSQFDSVHSQMALSQYNDAANTEIHHLHHLLQKQTRKQDLQARRTQERALNMVADVRSFDSVLSEAEEYMLQMEEMQRSQDDDEQPPHRKGFFGFKGW
ncbi:hypothetical protein [Acinetobacter boissieri]|uniref:Uncharacterized protein n=1 Tax=Acinetobacter boissieri TaxID=1219383 RepID=A0A1G6KEU1_9GAMM|nr:hypothetical protein [Acinetobacter boissieri]SDC28816.1 hypothetical protein SAMN05421733_11616 [Acinetobacter boissieri]